MAVRKCVELADFVAFAKGNDKEGVLHYGAHNVQRRRFMRHSVVNRKTTLSQASWACNAWNGQAGCFPADDDCGFMHIILKVLEDLYSLS